MAALVVDDSPLDGDDDIPDWVPAEWLSPVVGDSSVSDIYGAIGVWPAAFVAAEALIELAKAQDSSQGTWRCVEIGCGAGFPSLVAAKLGACVHALDSEQLPLELLEASFQAQSSCGVFSEQVSLQTSRCDVCETGSALDEALAFADIVVVSDLLYSVEVGEAMGRHLGAWARKNGQKIVLTDGRRTGSQRFLEVFTSEFGGPSRFEQVPIPSWTSQCKDLFTGERTSTVGLLKY